MASEITIFFNTICGNEGMVRILTPKLMIRYGYIRIISGAGILLINLYTPIFFTLEILLHLLLIIMGAISIVAGIKSVKQGKEHISNGIGPNDPISPQGTYANQKNNIPMKTCPACGEQISLEARFCPQCRVQLSDLRIA